MTTIEILSMSIIIKVSFSLNYFFIILSKVELQYFWVDILWFKWIFFIKASRKSGFIIFIIALLRSLTLPGWIIRLLCSFETNADIPPILETMTGTKWAQASKITLGKPSLVLLGITTQDDTRNKFEIWSWFLMPNNFISLLISFCDIKFLSLLKSGPSPIMWRLHFSLLFCKTSLNASTSSNIPLSSTILPINVNTKVFLIWISFWLIPLEITSRNWWVFGEYFLELIKNN